MRRIVEKSSTTKKRSSLDIFYPFPGGFCILLSITEFCMESMGRLHVRGRLRSFNFIRRVDLDPLATQKSFLCILRHYQYADATVTWA